MTNLLSPLELDFQPVDLGVSARALSIARDIDRLPPGEWYVQIEKHTQAEGGGMIVELNQVTTMKVREWK